MRVTRIPDNWRGLGRSLMIATVICAAFIAGGIFDRLLRPDAFLAMREASLFQDFGQLEKYRAANLALAPDPHRIVFLGDSITYYWNLETSFPGKPYLDRGIDAQTTSQMLVRFRQDVIDLQPAATVILAGTNDLGDTSAAPASIPDIERNLQTMAELADAHHIRPVFASLLPVHDYKSSFAISAMRNPKNILVINAWLKSYCKLHEYSYIDYHSAMVSPNGMMRLEFSDDGIHPNAAGHRIMAAVAKEALEKALTAAQ
jgi:lysophospholipase L1-like esterase